jgi:alginate O-acetyltransferase complex protein AlgJ
MSHETVYSSGEKKLMPSPHALLTAIALCSVMALGAWQISTAARDPGGLDFPRTWLDFRQGRTTLGLEKQLDHKLPARETLIAFANSVRYVLTGGTGDKVRPGSDDWLFSVDELQFFNDAKASQQSRLATLTHAASALKAQGVTLLVALVPDKARVYARHMPGGHYPYWHAERYNSILGTLNAQGVQTVDLLSALSRTSSTELFYYRTDTHWNQLGAQRAAEAVAARVKILSPDLPQTSFVSQTTGPKAPRTGDLLRMTGLSNMPDWIRPMPDEEAPVSTQKKEEQQAGGLFDNVSVPVALVGTSYSQRANFHGYLQQALGAEVLNVARDGGGFIQSAKDYLADESFKTAKPRVLIWEVPERMFSAPLTDIERQGLPL